MKNVLLFLILAALTFSGCGDLSGQTEKSPPTSQPPETTVVDHSNYSLEGVEEALLLRAKNLKIYFEHASVGSNILEGLEILGQEDERFSWEPLNRTSVNSDSAGAKISPTWFSSSGGFADLSRGYPASGPLGPRDKLDFFTASINGGLGDVVDLAMFKFCYLDGSVDGESLFAEVKSALEALEKSYPLVDFVWWTMPHQNWGNINIHRYNELVRAYCRESGRWLLDLSDLETRDVQGNQFIDQEHLKWSPEEKIPVINPGYTSDGGHLNQAGAAKVARAFWKLLILRSQSL